MRKMTKTVAVLAAMSAMTVASASLAFAATDNTAYSAIGKEAVAAGAASGEWDGDDVNGWTFTPANGTKLKGTWANINNAWYYFHKDGKMAQDELVYLEGETYYFHPDGRMQADGWVGFDDDSDVLYDYDLDIDENVGDIRNKVFETAADAYETVWMCFNADGTAKDDEWYQADSGLWYRFDDIVMVCGDFDHEVDNNYYGFDENGAMLVGWAKNYVDKGITAPNSDSTAWYWYDESGKKFNTSKNTNNNGEFGWKKIDGNWYCFREGGNVATQSYSEGTLITNSLFINGATAGSATNTDMYYVDKKGVMATGVVTVPAGAKLVDGDYGWNAGMKVENVVNSDWDIYFDSSNGKAKADAWSGDRFYASALNSDIVIFDADTFATTNYESYAVSGHAVSGTKATNKNVASDLKGALVKSAFIAKDDNLYYVDKYGDKVVNSAVQVGVNPANGYKQFILFDKKGVAYDLDATAIADQKEVKVGSKKYKAVGTYNNADEAVTLFEYVNNN